MLASKNPFDVHVYYSDETKASAMSLRQKMQDKFPWLEFYPPNDKPIGPHPRPMFEADFSQSTSIDCHFGQLVPWLMLNHNEHPVLVHPNTGNALKDHSINAIWIGEKLPLDFNFMTRET